MTAAALHALRSAPLELLAEIYAEVWRENDVAVIRDLILNDRFFLLTQVLEVSVAWHPWVLARCREVEADPDEHLDLWSRGHFKSTIITFAGVMQEILRDPEICVCIISYKAGAAEAFSSQIKAAFEQNAVLLRCFPDILWADQPDHKGPQWTVSDFTVRRASTRKESTVATSGLVSGMRTGGHYDLLVYDDTVTPDSVITVEMSQRTTDCWTMSLNLGSDGSEGTGRKTRHWYIGTRYAIYDTYAAMMERGIRPRVHLAVDDDGDPVYLSREALAQKRREMDAKTWASQIMQRPIGDGELVFKQDWWLSYLTRPDPRTLNRYIFVDTATKRAKRNDYTVMWVVGFGPDGNYYLLDGIRDKLSLSQRADAIFDLVERLSPDNVFWEANGSRADAEYIHERMDRVGWHFRITEIEQKLPKDDRIRWLEPTWRNGRMFFPTRLLYQTAGGDMRDLVRDFREEEWLNYPSVTHDDMLDCLANIHHPDVRPHVSFPRPPGDRTRQQDSRTASMRGPWRGNR